MVAPLFLSNNTTTFMAAAAAASSSSSIFTKCITSALHHSRTSKTSSPAFAISHPLRATSLTGRKHEASSFLAGGDRSLQLLATGFRRSIHRKNRDLISVHCAPQPEHFLPFWPSTGDSWFNWIVGLGVAIPLLVQRILTLTKQVDATAQLVEKVADTVEKAAEGVEKMAEDIEEALPEGSALRNLADRVDKLAEATAKDARAVEKFMDKIEEVDEDLENLLTKQSKRRKD